MSRQHASALSSLGRGDPSEPNVLWQLQKDFQSRAPDWGPALFKQLKIDGISNTGLRGPQEDDGPWLLSLKLSESLQQRFALAPDVLLLALPEREVQGRDLQRAYEEIVAAGFGLDSDVLIVVDPRPKLFDRLRRMHRWGQWIPWQPESRHGRSFFVSLAEQLRKYLPEYDIFDVRDPIRGHQVIGRKDAIFDLSRRLEAGKSLGIFGLRKVGKTTLMRAVTDILDPVSAALSVSGRDERHRPLTGGSASRILAVWLDCQRLIHRTREGVASLILNQLQKRLSVLDVRLDESGRDPLEAIALLLEQAALGELPPVCIVLDEYDLLFEGGEGQPAVPGLESVFGLFRAHAQATGKLSVAVIGRDPEFFQRPQMNGVTNPMLSWFTSHWVGPLDQSGSDELIGTLGRRVGLDVGWTTKRWARAWTGGHPLLHRQYGSTLLALAQRSQPSKESVPTDPLCEEAIELFLERDAVIEICREVYDLLLGRYHDAAVLLDELAREQDADMCPMLELHGGFRSPSARVLRNFGLLSGTPQQPALPEVIRWYTKSYLPPIRSRTP